MYKRDVHFNCTIVDNVTPIIGADFLNRFGLSQLEDAATYKMQYLIGLRSKFQYGKIMEKNYQKFREMTVGIRV